MKNQNSILGVHLLRIWKFARGVRQSTLSGVASLRRLIAAFNDGIYSVPAKFREINFMKQGGNKFPHSMELDTLINQNPTKMMKIILCLTVFVIGLYVFSVEKVEPLSGKLSFEKGKVGKSAVFPGLDKLRFGAEYLKANAGTVEMWVLVNSQNQEAFSFLLSIGSNNPLWFMTGMDKFEPVFHYSKKSADKKYDFYCNIKNKTNLLKPGEWHHLSYVWAFIKAGECLMQIYVDGQLKEEKWDLSTGEKWEDADKFFAVGFNSASATAPVFSGQIDELRISNYPKLPSEIKMSFQKGGRGEPLSTEPGTLLLLNFDDSTAGFSATKEAETKEKVAKSAGKIMDELYPKE